MKAKIIAGKIYLPKKVREKVKLIEGKECEITIVGDEIRIRPPYPENLKMLKVLKSSKPKVKVEDMMRAEIIEDA